MNTVMNKVIAIVTSTLALLLLSASSAFAMAVPPDPAGASPATRVAGRTTGFPTWPVVATAFIATGLTLVLVRLAASRGHAHRVLAA